MSLIPVFTTALLASVLTGPFTKVQSGPPIMLPSALAGNRLWYDASDLSTITMDGSNKVSQLNDKSPIGSNATQGSISIQPVYDPVKKVIGAPTAEGKLVIPNNGNTPRWQLLVAYMDFTQTQNDGTLATINGNSGGVNSRSPITQYLAAGQNRVTIGWRASDGSENSLPFSQGVDFPANLYFALLTWFDSSDGSFKAIMNNGAVKTVGTGLLPIGASQTGFFGDFRAGWTKFGIRTMAMGTDFLTPAQISGLMNYGMQQAAQVNAA